MSRQIADWLDGFLEYTDNTEPPYLFRLWTAISTIAAVMQRKCRLEWGMETFYPNMYIVLVGPPAARKGTAIKPGNAFLDQLGIQLAADETSRQKLVATLIDAAATEQNEEGDLEFHASLTIVSSELTVFLGYQNNELLTILCKWFDCENRFIYDTHSRGREEVANVWVNLLGATTPMLLQTSMPEGAVGSGFTSRTIFVFEPDKGKVVIIPVLSEEQEIIKEALLADLGKIRAISGRYVFTEQFLLTYQDWRVEQESKQVFTEPRLEFYIQRRPLHLLKLSMIIAAARRDERVLEEDDLLKAMKILNQTEEKMPQVFQGVGGNPLAPIQLRIMRLLDARGSIKASELTEMFFNDASKQQLAEIIATLETMNFCRIDHTNRAIVRTRK